MGTTRRQFITLTGGTFAVSVLAPSMLAAENYDADVCVYGGTASGVAAAMAAAMAAADEGAKVIVIEPSRWLGGMSGGGTTAPTCTGATRKPWAA